MSEEQQYWLAVIKCLAGTFLLFIIVLVCNYKITEYQIRKGVEAGSSAVVMACAFEMSTSHPDALCGTAIVK